MSAKESGPVSGNGLSDEQRAALEVLAGPLRGLLGEVERLLENKPEGAVSFAKLRACVVALQKPMELAVVATAGAATAEEVSPLEQELEAAKSRIAELERLEGHLRDIKECAEKNEETWARGVRDFTAGADLLMGRVVASSLGRSRPQAWDPVFHPGGGASEAWRCSFGGGGASEAWRCSFGGGGASEAWRCSFGGGGASEAWRCSFGGGGASEAWRCPFGGGGGSEAWRCPDGDR